LLERFVIMSSGAEQWVEQEFADVAFGDARLAQRFRSLVVETSRVTAGRLWTSPEKVDTGLL